MSRSAPSFRRRLAIGTAAIVIAAIGPLATSLEAGAATGSGSGLGAVNVRAVAHGVRMPLYQHQGQDAQLDVPFSVSDLGGGGVAHALTTFLWPGATGAALGSTLGVLTNDQVPASIQKLLNDPFKAEAPTTQGEEKVSLSQPGFTMEALAQPTHVNASSALGLSNLASFKNNAGPLLSATTNIAFKGEDTVVADASSTLTDLAIGPLTIGSIVSAAHATSNGKHATGTTTTNIVGAKIAGVSVTIGHDGISIADQRLLPASVIATVNKTVNSALKAAGIKIFVTKASKVVQGSQVSLSSSELIVMLKKAGYRSGVNDTGILIELGGASINANATGGYVAPVIPTSEPSAEPTSNGTTDIPDVTPPGGDIPPGSSVMPPTTAPPPALAANPLSLPGPLSSWWTVFGVLLALVAAYLLSLLPGRAFAAAAAGCRLEEES
jgi:hypothetical protein